MTSTPVMQVPDWGDGVVSYFVAQSAHDIGVRMALGAESRVVLGMILGSAPVEWQ